MCQEAIPAENRSRSNCQISFPFRQLYELKSFTSLQKFRVYIAFVSKLVGYGMSTSGLFE